MRMRMRADWAKCKQQPEENSFSFVVCFALSLGFYISWFYCFSSKTNGTQQRGPLLDISIQAYTHTDVLCTYCWRIQNIHSSCACVVWVCDPFLCIQKHKSNQLSDDRDPKHSKLIASGTLSERPLVPRTGTSCRRLCRRHENDPISRRRPPFPAVATVVKPKHPQPAVVHPCHHQNDPIYNKGETTKTKKKNHRQRPQLHRPRRPFRFIRRRTTPTKHLWIQQQRRRCRRLPRLQLELKLLQLTIHLNLNRHPRIPSSISNDRRTKSKPTWIRTKET